jgi:tetratricopeptide (TPR) repeat protein
MLESTQVAPTGLERGLAELGAFGLVRPPQILLAEYLRTLTAENVLDLATAEQVTAAYNRVHYSAAGEDDPDVLAAVAALGLVAQRLAAMNLEERRQVAARVWGRLESQRPEELERDTECLSDNPTPAPAARSTPTAAMPRPARPRRAAEAAAALDTPIVKTAKSDRRSSFARVSVEVAGVAALVMFFGGYFLRDTANKITEANASAFASTSPKDLTVRDAWKNREIWLNGLFLRAHEEAQSQQYDKARLGFELGLAYEPNNPTLLNDLASLYLTADSAGRTDPKRAVELIERAMAQTRHPTVLDTAAEAYFQSGKVAEAIRLESEALDDPINWTAAAEFRERREKQLRKFQGSGEIRTAAESPSRPLRPVTLGLSGVVKRNRFSGPLAISPEMRPAGS